MSTSATDRQVPNHQTKNATSHGSIRFMGCSCHTSRRHFLAGAAAVGAATLLHGNKTHAQGASSKLIDTHHHFYPPAYQKAWGDWEDQRKLPHLGVQLTWTKAA